MTYCHRCGGILTDKHTILQGDKEGESLHYYCAWKNEQEKKAKFNDDFDKKIQERRKAIKDAGGNSF